MAPNLGLLILRLVLGSIMFGHGAQKVLGWFGGPGMQGVVGFMGQMGIPAPLAWVAALVEFVGGLMVIFGVLARLAAFGFAINMVVATFLVHWRNGFFGGEGGTGWEWTLALLAMSLAVVLVGPGRYAIADPEPRWFGRRSHTPASTMPQERPAHT